MCYTYQISMLLYHEAAQQWKFLYKKWAHEIACVVAAFILRCTKIVYLHADSKCKLQPVVCFKCSVRFGVKSRKVAKKESHAMAHHFILFYFIKQSIQNRRKTSCAHISTLDHECWCHFSSYNFKYFIISSSTLNILIVM